ncbi:hypothetical protein, partial [Heyndrickxia sporothermodurans]|uniref:hypothetical protein n=1 Tax=Heyndrickxia sporothermodurans TaxID=46224 RepID=UPI000D4968D0
MKNNLKKMSLYFTLVLVPALLMTLSYGYYSFKKNNEKSIMQTERDASIYQRQLDQVFGETIKSLEVLAI